MQFDSLTYPYASRRAVTFAQNGIVATGQHLAAQAGLSVMKNGGNAIDAAVATAAALTVLEPNSNSIGSDAFAIVWTRGKLYGLNASGAFPQSISLDKILAAGHQTMPSAGWLPVTVPGAPAAWQALVERFGNCSLSEVLKPAITYAAEGYPVPAFIANEWQKHYQSAKTTLHEAQYESWFKTFAPLGRAPLAGEIWRSEAMAKSLRQIAETKAKAFYQGELAEKIDRFSRENGGDIRLHDLAAFQPSWIDPIKVAYRGFDVWELPPNGQGLVALIALGLLNGFEFPERDCVETLHRQIEAMKLAFADGQRYIADPDCMSVQISDLLSTSYLDERRKLITDSAAEPQAGNPSGSDTVYLATADSHGNMVSYIQSHYKPFGSFLVVPDSGIALQNRGACASLDRSHDNVVRPGKRPYHTIIPGFLTRDGQPVGPFGVMGGFMQPQGHLQVLMNTLDFGMNPQAALDAPRWRWDFAKNVAIEADTPEHLIKGLLAKGHQVTIQPKGSGFGRGQIIWRHGADVLVAGTEPRADGAAAAY